MKDNTKMEEILNAAIYLFSTKGYLQTSMTEIADAVNLTKGGIYHYLDKKEDALVMIHEQMTDAFILAFREASESAESPKDKLAAWIRAHAQLMRNYQPHIKIFFNELRNLRASSRFDAIVAKRDQITDTLYDIFKQGRKEKCFRDDIHPKILTFLVMGMMNWFYQWYRPNGPRAMEDIIGDVQRLVFEGALKRPAAVKE